MMLSAWHIQNLELSRYRTTKHEFPPAGTEQLKAASQNARSADNAPNYRLSVAESNRIGSQVVELNGVQMYKVLVECDNQLVKDLINKFWILCRMSNTVSN